MTTATASPTWLTSPLASGQCGGLATSTPGGTQAIGSGAAGAGAGPRETAGTRGEVGARVDGVHAREALRGRGVDGDDLRVRLRRADERRPQLPGDVEVVDVAR